MDCIEYLHTFKENIGIIKQIQHKIRLKGYKTENGKIPFSLLKDITLQVTRIAESTLLSYVEGNSTIKRGKTPVWLSNSLDFKLTGIKKGSTVLQVEAPTLNESIGQFQLPLFQDFNSNELENKTALDLSFYAYKQATSENNSSHLLDKNLLNELSKLSKILDSDKAELIFETKDDTITVNKRELNEIQILEQKAPESLKTQIKGKLDALSHSKSQLELITDGKKIRAQLSTNLNFDDIFEYFGEDVVITGMAHFTPNGTIKSFEILKIRISNPSDSYFEKIPTPIFPEFQISEIEKSKYNGSKLSKLFGKWPGDESTDDLLELLTK